MTRRTHLRTPLFLLTLFLMLLIGISVSAQVNVIIVDDAGDDGTGSIVTLREALALADGDDLISVQAGIGPILLEGQLNIDQNTSIDLNGNEVRVAGSTAHRVFDVTNGDVLTVVDGTLTGSLAVGEFTGNGGVIRTAGETILRNVTVQDGSVSGAGGGIYVTGSNSLLNTETVTIQNNEAGQGGGVYGDLTSLIILFDTTVTGNTIDAPDDEDQFGAGVAALNRLLVSRSTVSNNTGAYLGGGIYSSGASLVITDSTVSKNQATVTPDTDLYGSGGGVYVRSGLSNAFIGLSSIDGNSAHRGGGIFTQVDLDLFNSTLYANVATDEATLSDEAGGAIYVESGTLASSFVTYADNDAVDNADSGIALGGGTASLINSILSNSGDGNCSPASTDFTDEGGNLDSGTSCGFGGSSLSSQSPDLLTFSNGVLALDDSAPSAAIDFSTDCTASDEANFSVGVTNFADVFYSPGESVEVDQRRAPRTPASNNCDSGAYEVQGEGTADVIVTVFTNPATVSETGFTSVLIGVRLASEPQDDDSAGSAQVTLALSPDDQIFIENKGTEYTSSDAPLELVFNETNWSIVQYVRIYGVDDGIRNETDPHDGVLSYAIVTAETTDNDYDALTDLPDTVVDVENEGFDRFVNIEGDEIFEGDTTLTFRLLLDDDDDPIGSGTVTVEIRILAGTATEGEDYEYDGPTVFTIDEEDDGEIEFTVDILSDDIAEGNEFFTVFIDRVENAQIGPNFFAFGGIFDEDDIDFNLDIFPETLPTGQVDVEYEQTFSASGGDAPYIFFLPGLDEFPGDWEFDNDGVLRGTADEPFTVTFTVFVIDNTGSEFGRREYTVDFTLTGLPFAIEALTPTPVPTLTAAENAATIEADRVALLGPPVVEINPALEIGRVYIRSGPASGATIINIAQAGRQYDVIGTYSLPNSTETWYLIEYPLNRPDVGFIGEEGNEDELLILERGWVSDRYMLLSGYAVGLPRLGNPFDGVSLAGTGITGRSEFKNNLYTYPTPDSRIVEQFDEGSTFEILGRTRVDQRDISNWMLVRMDRGGAVGWIKYTPYIDVNGDASTIPQY